MYKHLCATLLVFCSAHQLNGMWIDAKTLLSLTTEHRALAIDALEEQHKKLAAVSDWIWNKRPNSNAEAYAQILCQNAQINTEISQVSALLAFAQGLARHEEIMISTSAATIATEDICLLEPKQ